MSNINILGVFLWQKNGLLRELEFLPNRVNVITGDSGKGKSSVLYIIDYCLLASETSGISKANIDSKVNWYGVRLRVGEREFFIARPSVGGGGSTSEAYFNDKGVVPDVPVLNVRIGNLKKVLNESFGIDAELRVPYGGQFVMAGSRVSYRNFLAYCYQDQNTIVAPDHLYIRPSSGRYQESVERTFRMAIGAEGVKTALARGKLADLERRKALEIRKAESYRRSANAFSEEVEDLINGARHLGLVDEVPETYEERIQSLSKLLENPVLPDAIDQEVRRIEGEIFALNSKNKQLQSFVDDRPSFVNMLKETEEALKPVSIFNEQAADIFPSPLANSVISRLQLELSEIKASLRGRKGFPFIDEVRALIEQNARRVLELRKELASLEGASVVARRSDEYFRYLGRLEAKLEVYQQGAAPVMDTDTEQYDAAIAELGAVVDIDREKSYLARQELNKLINERLEKMPLKGYSGFSGFYNEKDRAIHLHSADLSAIEKMQDVGSASNYLYLHVAYFLALHEIAKRRKISWVPSFLVLDQVSTPYFSSDGKAGDDIRSLDKVLTELNAFVERMDEHGGFQVILLEHIGKEHWERLGLSRFHLVDQELRGDYGLILDDLA